MKFAILLFFLGLAAVVVSGLGLAWDGAYQMVELLEAQNIGAAFGRYTLVPIFFLVRGLSYFTENLNLLVFSFEALHALLPILSLLGAWFLVRERKPAAVIWIALGIGLFTLPSQACLVCQSIIAVQVVWVLIAAILAGMERSGVILTLVASPIILFLHPVAILIFALAAVAVLVRSWQQRRIERSDWKWLLFFGLMTIAALVRTLIFRTAYEAEQTSWREWQTAYDVGVAGYPLQMLVFAWSAAALIFVEPIAGKMRRIAQVGAIVALFAAFITLAEWALDAQAWANALDYRDWAFFILLPVFGFALFDRSILLGQFRRFALRAVGTGFAIVLVMQSSIWLHLSNRLQEELGRSSGCVEARHIEGIPGTAMGGWSLTSYAMLLQGKRPSALAYYWESCANENFTAGYWIAKFNAWDYIRWDSGWFSKDLLRSRLAVTACDFSPNAQFPSTPKGWYPLEVDTAGFHRWMMQTAQIYVTSKASEPAESRLGATLRTTRGAKELQIDVNGAPALTLHLEDDAPHKIDLPLRLTPGQNVIALEVRFSDRADHDYPPALLVSNARITRGEERPLCP